MQENELPGFCNAADSNLTGTNAGLMCSEWHQVRQKLGAETEKRGLSEFVVQFRITEVKNPE